MEENLTALGHYLRQRGIAYGTAAVELGVTRSYVSMLVTGKASPGLKLAGEIEDWTEGEVSMRSWYEWLLAHPSAAERKAKVATETPAAG